MKYYEDINKGQICTENYDRSGGKCKWGIYSSERHIGKTGNYIKIYGTDYADAKEPEEYTAGDIIRTTEGSLAPIACLDDVPNRCERQDQCSTLEFWEGLKKVIDQYVDSVTLADLVNNHEEKCGKLDL